MSEDKSEEKSLPPTDKKLKDARRKGQVSSSQDFVAGLSMTTVVTYLWISWPGMIQRWEAMFALPAQLGDASLITATHAMLQALGRLGAAVVLPIVILAPAAAVVANLIAKGGIPFAMDPVVPKFDRIHPATGFKRIFSLKSLVDFVKSLTKAALLLTCLCAAILFGLNALLQAPACGIDCVTGTFSAVMRPLLIAATILFLLTGLIDIGLQRRLFLRDMRMTKSEARREYKEMEGEPTFRQTRRQRHRESTAGTRLGVTNATIVIASPGRFAVALRFVRDETPAPVLVARAHDAQATSLVAEARAAEILIIDDPALAERLADLTELGGFIPKSLFQEVAAILVHLGLV